MTRDEVTAFERQPGAKNAVALRRWDDEAKVLDLDVGTLDRHRALLERLAR
jgi:predicted HD phosphohydrolase